MGQNSNVSNLPFKAGVITLTGAAVAMNLGGFRANVGIKFVPDSSNTGSAYVGDSDATASARSFLLPKGVVTQLEVENHSKLFLVGSNPGDKVWYFAI